MGATRLPPALSMKRADGIRTGIGLAQRMHSHAADRLIPQIATAPAVAWATFPRKRPHVLRTGFPGCHDTGTSVRSACCRTASVILIGTLTVATMRRTRGREPRPGRSGRRRCPPPESRAAGGARASSHPANRRTVGRTPTSRRALAGSASSASYSCHAPSGRSSPVRTGFDYACTNARQCQNGHAASRLCRPERPT